MISNLSRSLLLLSIIHFLCMQNALAAENVNCDKKNTKLLTRAIAFGDGPCAIAVMQDYPEYIAENLHKENEDLKKSRLIQAKVINNMYTADPSYIEEIQGKFRSKDPLVISAAISNIKGRALVETTKFLNKGVLSADVQSLTKTDDAPWIIDPIVSGGPYNPNPIGRPPIPDLPENPARPGSTALYKKPDEDGPKVNVLPVPIRVINIPNKIPDIASLVHKNITKGVYEVMNGKGSSNSFAFKAAYNKSLVRNCGIDQTNDNFINNPEKNKEDNFHETAAWIGNLFFPKAIAASISIEDRIKNCASIFGSNIKTKSGVNWNLVSRKYQNNRYYEVWRDSGTGAVWGDKLDKAYKHYDAVALNSRGQVLAESACDSKIGIAAYNGISEKRFGIPTAEDFQKAKSNGLAEVLPNMNDDSYWSVTVDSNSKKKADGINPSGDIVAISRSEMHAVRCIGR